MIVVENTGRRERLETKMVPAEGERVQCTRQKNESKGWVALCFRWTLGYVTTERALFFGGEKARAISNMKHKWECDAD